MTFYQGDSYLMMHHKLRSAHYSAIITSPPYRDRYDYGHPDQTGYDQTYEQYLEYNRALLEQCYRVLLPGGAMFINLGNLWNNYGTVKRLGDRQMPKNYDRTRPRTPLDKSYREKSMLDLAEDWVSLCRSVGFILRDRYIWVKPLGLATGSDRSANCYETVLYLRKPDRVGRYTAHYWHKRYLPSNVLSYAPESSPVHPCPMPKRMYEDLMLATVPKGGYVLDPYGGTGQIVDIAKRHDRYADYIDIIDYDAKSH